MKIHPQLSELFCKANRSENDRYSAKMAEVFTFRNLALLCVVQLFAVCRVYRTAVVIL